MENLSENYVQYFRSHLPLLTCLRVLSIILILIETIIKFSDLSYSLYLSIPVGLLIGVALLVFIKLYSQIESIWFDETMLFSGSFNPEETKLSRIHLLGVPVKILTRQKILSLLIFIFILFFPQLLNYS